MPTLDESAGWQSGSRSRTMPLVSKSLSLSFAGEELPMHIRRSLLLATVLALGIGPVLAQVDSKVQERRQEIDSNAQTTLDGLMNTHTAVRDLYGRAVGYAVFTVTKGGFIVSGGGGNGVAVNKGTGQRTY